jgi:histone deacetylase 11
VRVVYSDHYNITFFGIEKFHPFDSRKYGRAWELLQSALGPRLARCHVPVDRVVSDEELLLVHTPEYLARLSSSTEIASALEMPLFRAFPASLLRERVLVPMRWAVRGSVVAAKMALETGRAVNLSGGYHHAKPDCGEGFCLFADAALIVRQLRTEGLLRDSDDVLYIDLDAHQGNGVCHQFLNDRKVRIFDMYNGEIYPSQDLESRGRIDWNVSLPSNYTGTQYLQTLREKLPSFIAEMERAGVPRLAIYNAGTDPFVKDPLGGLGLSAEDILARDLFVFEQLQARAIPTVMLLSGGYSAESYRLVAATVRYLVEKSAESG